MNHDYLSTLAELYALDVLDSSELQDFRAHLSAGCPECEKIISLTREDLSRAAFSLQPQRPSPAVKAALMEKISVPAESGLSASPVTVADRIKQWWLAGALVLATSLMFLIPMPSNSIHDKEMTRILSTGHVEKVHLASSSQDPDADAELVWNVDACGGCLVIKNLVSLSGGQVYQVWATQDNKAPVSLGIFSVDKDGKAHMDIKGKTSAAHFQSFAITREPAGGVVSPTGPVFLSGKF